MIDLPIVLGGARPTSSGSPEAAPRKSNRPLPRSGVSDAAWPWWMAPARLAGRVRPALLESSAADAAAMRRLPRVVVVVALPLIVILLAGVVSAFHATSLYGHTSSSVSWLRFVVDDVFTESPPFMLGAIALGVFSPALGAFLVAVFGVMDIAAATRQSGELTPFPSALIGRLVAIWLLWLLAVEIPTFGRQLALSWRSVARNRFALAGLAAVATGAFTWIWTLAATVLVRPIWTWSRTPGVRLEAIFPVQSAGLVFGIAAAIVAGAVALRLGPEGLLTPLSPSLPGAAATDARARVRLIASRLVVAALLTISLGGLISVPLEAVALFLTLAGAGPLARLVADRTSIAMLLGGLPQIARYGLAAVLTFAVSQITIAPLYHFAAYDGSGRVPQFFSVIIAVAIGIFLVELVTTPGTRPAGRAKATSSIAVGATLVASLALLMLLAPASVMADNCAGLSDCWSTPFLAALAGGALPMAMAAGAGLKDAWRSWRSSKYEQQTTGRAVLGVRG